MTSKAVLVSNPLLTLDNTTTTQLRFPSESPPRKISQDHENMSPKLGSQALVFLGLFGKIFRHIPFFAPNLFVWRPIYETQQQSKAPIVLAANSRCSCLWLDGCLESLEIPSCHCDELHLQSSGESKRQNTQV